MSIKHFRDWPISCAIELGYSVDYALSLGVELGSQEGSHVKDFVKTWLLDLESYHCLRLLPPWNILEGVEVYNRGILGMKHF